MSVGNRYTYRRERPETPLDNRSKQEESHTMAIRHIDTWSTSLYTSKKLNFTAKLDGDQVQTADAVHEAIVRSVTRQAQDLADRYQKMDNGDLDLDPRPGHVLVANSATMPSPMLYNDTNSAAERYEFDVDTGAPKELFIKTESGDSVSHLNWENGKLTRVEEFRSLNQQLQKNEKMLITIDPKTGTLNYSETGKKRWF